MNRSLVLKASFGLATLALIALTSYQVGATTTARPVVRQQFVRRLDPGSPDFEILPANLFVASDSSWKVHQGFDPAWIDVAFDDSRWSYATLTGQQGLVGSFANPVVRAIWTDDVSGPDDTPVTFRTRFSMPASTDQLTMYVTVDNDFRVYLNAQFVGQDADHDWTTTSTLDLTVYAIVGENTMAIEGLDSDSFTLGMACMIVDETYDPLDPVFISPAGGSAWAMFDVPQVTAQSQVTAELDRVSVNPDWETQPQLQGLRPLSPRPALFARQRQILVQLTTGYGDGRRVLVEPGTYRLIVDTVSP